jgi:hypothetical protein
MTLVVNKKQKWTFQQILEAISELPPPEQHRLLGELNKLVQVYLVPPDTSSEAIQYGRHLAEEIREELKKSSSGSLDEAMSSLRGRAWS